MKSMIKALWSRLAKREGKKHQATMGDIEELVGLICEEIAIGMGCSRIEPGTLLAAMVRNGRRRLRKRKEYR